MSMSKYLNFFPPVYLATDELTQCTSTNRRA